MPLITEPLRATPIPPALRKQSLLGAKITLPSSISHLDPSLLTPSDTATLRSAVLTHGVVVLRNQHSLNPSSMPSLARIFDTTALDIHSGGSKMVTDKKNILSENRGARIPRAPQVSVIGSGTFEGHEGIPKLDLKHVNHTEFHETPHTEEEIAEGFTRPYRWHMDAPLYERLPGVVTTLHAIRIPELPRQKIRFPAGEVMELAAGATAFFSGARSFELLTEEEKHFALHTTIVYAPRAYEWMRDCKATDDGLTIARTGREKRLEELPEWTWDQVHKFPMVWRNPHTSRPHLQILGCCVYELHTTNPTTGEVTVMKDLDEVRSTVHKLQSKVYTPENIYAHEWKEGDLVIFHNRGVLHSITGNLGKGEDEKRLLWQCSMASGTPPEGFVEGLAV